MLNIGYDQNISNFLIPRRQYMQMLRSLKDQNIIKVITGVRRCGKSTLLQMYADELLQKGVEQAHIQFLNFEDPDIYMLGDWKDIYDYVKVRLLPDKMNYVFLDEVQNVATFERLVDGLFIKKNVDLYITGSNAWLLSSELATLLTGRYIEINILPLYFDEFQELMMLKPQNLSKSESFAVSDVQSADNQIITSAKSPNLSKTESLAISDIQNTEYQIYTQSKSPNLSKTESLAIFCTEGGIPEYFKQKNISQKQADEFVRSVLNTIIEKDIF
ncbi:MAG: AAA family ATPase, partial [Tannerella sp.]|nr:AAA family ATPase [Tannerella sp.]